MEKAFVCVTINPPAVQRVLQEIKAVDGVESTQVVFGAYDVCFNVEQESLDKLKYVLSEKITRMDDVRKTLTLFRANPE